MLIDMTRIAMGAARDDESLCGPYPQFILFGDSITQWSSEQELGFNFMPALQNGKRVAAITDQKHTIS